MWTKIVMWIHETKMYKLEKPFTLRELKIRLQSMTLEGMEEIQLATEKKCKQARKLVPARPPPANHYITTLYTYT